jgi:hypothetical protein
MRVRPFFVAAFRTREAHFEGENCMSSFLHLGGVVAATATFAALAPSAIAQEAASVWTCQDIGAPQPEPLGDREGHSLFVGNYSCRIEGGSLSGAVATGSDIWENDGPKSTRLSSQGVIRKPGAMAAWNGGTGTTVFTITDGKITGWTASGTGKNLLATGAWAPLSGKSDAWTAKPTGPGQFTVEQKFE